MKPLALALSTLLFFPALSAAVIEGDHPTEIRLVSVKPTPEPDAVAVRVVFPLEGEVKKANPVQLQLRVEGYPLGYPSEFARAREIRVNKDGQRLRLLIDGATTPIDIEQAIDDMADSEEIDFDQTVQVKIPFDLSNGEHVVRAFPIRSYGECLKGDETMGLSFFFLSTKEKQKFDLTRPFLTYNEPRGRFSGKQPILLDFYLSNTQLSKDGYKVRLTIDGADKRILTEWMPYYVYGLTSGSHTVRLDLLDPKGNVVPGLFDDTQATIQID